MNRKLKTILICAGIVVVCSIASYFAGQEMNYKHAYRDGVIFADSSSYKRGKADGYREGYSYCDRIKDDLDSLRKTEMFNLNIILEELANPKKYIRVEGAIETKKVKEGLSTRSVRYVKGNIINRADFARYNELVIIARYKDKRQGVVGESKIELEDVLYPRQSMSFERDDKDIPDLAQSVEFIIEKAESMD